MTGTGGTTRAMQFGQWLGRRWLGFLRFEERVLMWLQRTGVPIPISKILCWILKVVIIVALLYVAFWITLIVLFIATGAIGVIRGHVDLPEWRYGPEGYGYYENGIRTDYGRLFEDDD